MPSTLAVDGKLVVEHRVGADGLHPQLAVNDPKRLRELRADVMSARTSSVKQECQVLRADHRPPRPVQGSNHVRRVHADRHDRRRPARYAATTGSEYSTSSASMVARLETAYHAGPLS